ncbi:BZ3500_MvSof-1268-A1-R1_C065g00316 [Microbotryum saponariae]|uniref:BZ3500_MvSof-1268-A1-R1_C065g00316 protein n=1 Tax=Microbotryum saponariae TaxID=289078 RepID=A0A2X0KNE8_9BASI|nr:BZ3500_MvSof-1268-A1-R1_C065g00316 [Microbotryum saponariae]
MSWLNQPYAGGYPGQQPQPGYLQSQPTGYMGQPMQQQPLQGQRTGYAPQGGFQQPQPTGFIGQRLPMQQMQSQPTGYAPSMLQPQPTGYRADAATAHGDRLPFPAAAATPRSSSSPS